VDQVRARYARELIDAANSAIARDPAVRACLERARADAIDLRVSVDVRVEPAGPVEQAFAITAADRRFLRSLHIAADPPDEP
jgi:hypothetical protein